MSAPDLLQWLLTCGKTGILRVEGNGVEKRLYFNKGAIVGASSSDPDLAFGQFPLDLGKVGEKTPMRLVRKQRATNLLLGGRLQQGGLVSGEGVGGCTACDDAPACPWQLLPRPDLVREPRQNAAAKPNTPGLEAAPPDEGAPALNRAQARAREVA